MRKKPQHSQRYDGPESSHRNSLWKEFMVAKAHKNTDPGLRSFVLARRKVAR